MHNLLINQLEEALQRAKNLADVNEALEGYLAAHQISTFAFSYYQHSPSSINKLKYDYYSKNFAVWHQHYLEQGYEDDDSTLDLVYQSSFPVLWNLRQQLKESRTKRERKMREDSIKLGAERGVSIPLHGPHDDFAILLLVEMRGESWMNDYRKIKFELMAASLLYFQSLQRFQLDFNIASGSANVLLKPREIQCLLLIAKNYSTAAIAKSLCITERTVNFHVQRLNKKLGTQNKYQSVLKALRKKMISL